MFRTPASIWFSGPDDVLDLDAACAVPLMATSAAASVTTAAPIRRRRYWLISSDISIPPLGKSGPIRPDDRRPVDWTMVLPDTLVCANTIVQSTRRRACGVMQAQSHR